MASRWCSGGVFDGCMTDRIEAPTPRSLIPLDPIQTEEVLPTTSTLEVPPPDERDWLEKYPSMVVLVVSSTVVIGLLLSLDASDALKGHQHSKRMI